MSPTLRLLVLIPLIVYSVLLLLIGSVALLAPGTSAPLDFVRTAYWALAWPLPLAWIIALLLRLRWLFLWLSMPLVAYVIYLAPYLLTTNQPVPPESMPVDVLTLNYLAREEPQIRAGSDLLLEADADIVALQEFGVPAADYLIESLGAQYPYQALNPQEGRYNYVRGQGVFSRHPILGYTYWQYEHLPYSHGNQRVVLSIEEQVVILYNIHPWPPFDFNGVLGIAFQEQDAISYQGAIDDLYERIRAETDPVLVVGDFNTGHDFAAYGRFTSILRDGFKDAGRGMGYTYPACGISFLPAVIRLDYILYSAPFIATDARVLESCGVSDHKGVIVTFALPPA